MDKILVIDDDKELTELLTDFLVPEGFDVACAHDGITGLEAVTDDIDLLILDVMLPGQNGFDVLRELRTKSSVPVIMLTARGDDVDRVVGLEMGADDYLPKPFLPRELVARIRAVLRRAHPSTAQAPAVRKTITLGDVELDTGTRRVQVNGIAVRLTDAEFSILATLLSSAGNVVSREQLSIAALGRETGPEDRSLDVHISNLRKKIGRTTDGLPRIKAVRGAGYLYTLPSV